MKIKMEEIYTPTSKAETLKREFDEYIKRFTYPFASEQIDICHIFENKMTFDFKKCTFDNGYNKEFEKLFMGAVNYALEVGFISGYKQNLFENSLNGAGADQNKEMINFILEHYRKLEKENKSLKKENEKLKEELKEFYKGMGL